MIGKRTGNRTPKGNAALEVQRLVEQKMRSSGFWVYADSLKAVLAEDDDLAARYHAETRKGLTPR